MGNTSALLEAITSNLLLLNSCQKSDSKQVSTEDEQNMQYTRYSCLLLNQCTPSKATKLLSDMLWNHATVGREKLWEAAEGTSNCNAWELEFNRAGAGLHIWIFGGLPQMSYRLKTAPHPTFYLKWNDVQAIALFLPYMLCPILKSHRGIS